MPSGPSVLDLLREAGGLDEALQELRAKEARREAMRFPRSGVERKTMQQIHQEIDHAQGALEQTRRPDVSDWTRAESLAEASKSLTEAGDLAAELGRMVRSGWIRKPRG